MEEILITEEELDYLINVPQTVAEESASYMKSEMSFEEESKDCITLEQFSRNIDEAIRRLIPNP